MTDDQSNNEVFIGKNRLYLDSFGAHASTESPFDTQDANAVYRLLVQNIHEYIYRVTFNGGEVVSTFHSDRCFDITGYLPSEYDADPVLWISMVHEHDRDRVTRFIDAVLAGREPLTIEHRIIHKNGTARWVSNTCAPERNARGELVSMNGFILDITARRNARLRQDMALKVLELLNRSGALEDTVRDILRHITDATGIASACIRIRNRGDDPGKNGGCGPLPDIVIAEGVRRDSGLRESIEEFIMSAASAPGHPRFTPYGSFWTNCASGIAGAAGLPEGIGPFSDTGPDESVALIPLKSDDRIIGILYCGDGCPGFFSDETIQFFERLGSSIGIAFSRILTEKKLSVANEMLQHRNEAIEKDMALAQLIYNKFLLNQAASYDHLRIEFRYLPYHAVGGDYFSFTPLSEGGIGIFIGDVVGHGISAALFLSLLKATTDRICRRHGMSPGAYLARLNAELIEYMNFNFLTAVYGLFRCNTGNSSYSFTFSNGGHPWPVIHRKSDDAMYLHHAEGTILGAYPDVIYNQETVMLSPGDRIYLYTDGIPEARNGQSDIIGFDEIPDLVRRSSLPDLGDTLDAIIAEVRRHIGDTPPDDDIVLIGLEVK